MGQGPGLPACCEGEKPSVVRGHLNRINPFLLQDNIVAAMDEYPETSAVLVRNHGIYLWAKTWDKAKIM